MKVGDKGTGHDGFPETVVISGSPDVYIEGMPAARVDDNLAPHSKPKHPPHSRTITSGAPGVYINGKLAAIDGGSISCGGVTIGSGGVFIGDGSTSPSEVNDYSNLFNHSDADLHSERNFPNASTASVTSQAKTATPQKVPQIDPNNAYWPPYNPLAKDGEKTLNVEYVKPITSIAWMSPEEAHEFLQNLYEDMGYKETISNMKDYGLGLGKGTYDAVEAARGLGGLGVQAYTKTINGQDWIIMKNYRKHLKTLERGHKWKANNPRIIKLGLGLNDLKGAARYVRFNVGLEIAVSLGINAVDYALRDEATLAEICRKLSRRYCKGDDFNCRGGCIYFCCSSYNNLGF